MSFAQLHRLGILMCIKHHHILEYHCDVVVLCNSVCFFRCYTFFLFFVRIEWYCMFALF